MAGITIEIKETGMMQVDAILKGAINRAADLSVPMQQGAVLMMRSIQQNFDRGGRPTPWRPLAASTLKQKAKKGYSDRPLIRTGGLRQSIASSTTKMSLKLGTNIIYGKIHEYGGRAGRHRSVNIPARPYLLFQEEDIKRLNQLVLEYLNGV